MAFQAWDINQTPQPSSLLQDSRTSLSVFLFFFGWVFLGGRGEAGGCEEGGQIETALHLHCPWLDFSPDVTVHKWEVHLVSAVMHYSPRKIRLLLFCRSFCRQSSQSLKLSNDPHSARLSNPRRSFAIEAKKRNCSVSGQWESSVVQRSYLAELVAAFLPFCRQERVRAALSRPDGYYRQSELLRASAEEVGFVSPT